MVVAQAAHIVKRKEKKTRLANKPIVEIKWNPKAITN